VFSVSLKLPITNNIFASLDVLHDCGMRTDAHHCSYDHSWSSVDEDYSLVPLYCFRFQCRNEDFQTSPGIFIAVYVDLSGC
jgi:hypothetical protein